jgi:multimeric flavodoxin WrbA
MANVLVLYGSPKKSGNTSTLGKRFLKGLSDGGIQDTQEFWLNDLSIKPCQGCFHCHPTKRCITQDDMQAIYPALEDAKAIVFAIPIFWWHMAAQMKLCFDRFTALLSDDDKFPALAGKDVTVIVSYNFRECAQGVIGMFEDFKGWIGIKLQVVEYCAQAGPVIENMAKLEETYELGKATAIRLGQAG